MNEIELTPWFDGDIKPVRKGVYMQMSGNGLRIGYQYFDGSSWCVWRETVSEAKAAHREHAQLCFQNDEWRGLAKKP